MLGDSKISDLYFEALGSQHLREQDRRTVSRFALAVEAEVRKDDEALIRQLRDALEHIQRCIGFGSVTIHYGSATWEQIDGACGAANDRLGETETEAMTPPAQVPTEREERLLQMLRSECNHAARNDMRLPPIFGQRGGRIAVPEENIEAAIAGWHATHHLAHRKS